MTPQLKRAPQAENAIAELERQRKRWKEVEGPPQSTADGYEWRCHSCRFRTLHVSEARVHVWDDEVNQPHEHMVFECLIGEEGTAAQLGIRRMYRTGHRVQCDKKVRRGRSSA